MKLLSKQVVSEQKSLERKREIDEGVKLAKKIDVLRETASQEEKKLAVFRKESLAVLHKEITEKSRERDALLAGVVSLRTEKERLQSILKSIR